MQRGGPGIDRFEPFLWLAIAAIVVAVYLPVAHAGFVWDDRIFLYGAAWLRDSDQWLQRIFEPLFDSQNYFRPLGLAVFSAEMKILGVDASAMHLVSLGLHLGNVILVGLLARRLSAILAPERPSTIPVCAAMLLFGLHPLLVEPVVWISCQFGLLALFFTLLGLLCHLTVRGTLAKSALVALCFFLAASVKEAAVSFPLLLAIVDWLRIGRSDAADGGWRRQLPVYAAVLAAGLAYLALRRWGMGYLLASSSVESLHAGSRLQLVSYAYLSYWKMILLPVRDLGPLHIVASDRFDHFSWSSAAIDAGAVALLAYGAIQFRYRRAIGGLILGVTAALLPVLHIVPIDFDDSAYHNRFAMPAIAVACAFLPATIARLLRNVNTTRRAGLAIACLFWLAVSTINVRVLIPLWSDDVLLWQWVLRDNPDSLIAEDNLIALYLDRGDLARARPLAARLKATASDRVNPMLNVAQLAILDRDADGARRALDAAKRAMRGESPHPRQVVGYIALVGDLRRLEGDLSGAEAAYRDAISLDPLIPPTHLSLALTLVMEGKLGAARAAASRGLALLAPDERARRQREFDAVFAAAAKDQARPKPAGN